jgi:AhpD family alkylhydroperoxidase
MGVLEQLRNFGAVLASAKRNRTDMLGWLATRPQMIYAIGVYETALVLSGRMPARLKYLAELKAAAMVTCEFCIDIGSAFARRAGITPRQLADLGDFRSSHEFSDDEMLVLEFAEAMTRIPATIDPDLRDRLMARFSRAQIVELATSVAWENHRGRLNQALGVRPSGFSDGQACAVPERGAVGSVA